MRIRLLGFLLLVGYFLGFSGIVVSQSGPDVSSMEALKSSLKLTGSGFDWSNPNPCQWGGVRCDKNNRVVAIQIRNVKIQGSIPSDLKNLTSLSKLELMGNKLTGPFPDLSGLSALQTLNIHDNQFSSIPSSLFSGMNSLQSVFLDQNPFSSWEIPDSLKDATSLQNFSAMQCNISGKIPDFLGGETFPSLVELHLAQNFLQGGLPASFSGSTIKSLWLNGQKSQTKLNGSISVLQNMTSLTDVWLNQNQFSGPIPDLSGLTSLQNFTVRDNQLTGIVPISLCKLPSLIVVNLTNNLLQGPTPAFEAKNVQVDLTPNTNSFCFDVPGKSCDSRVNVLLSIAESLSYPVRFAQNWKGNDPCNGWLGISCSAGNIVVINFKNMGLTGTISPSFANFTSLQTIILAQNNLTGTIPNQLTTLPKLATLDVSDNHLYGQVPKFTNNVDLNTKGNVDIGKDRPSGDRNNSSSGNVNKKSTSKIVGGVVGAVCAVVLVVLGVWLYIMKRQRPARVQSPYTMMTTPGHSGDHGGVKIGLATSGGAENESGHSHGSNGSSNVHLAEPGNMVISIQVLRSVTDNFSEKKILGRGGFGIVYRGELHDGTIIAVKRMESSAVSDKGLAEFKSEISVLTKVRHRHLVALLGHCLDGNERLLVYEFMPQGTLSRHLFHWKEEGLKPLEWTRRLSIALDVARGVEYLHTLAHQSFIHRDLKPSNILLGDDMRAKVSDFGLVRLAPDGKQSIETRIAGTFGYLAPEYAVTGRVTTKVDVYSFGVIIMEIISGRKALDETQPEDSLHLVTWFRRMLINKDVFKNAVDPTIELDEETLASVQKVSELAGHCCAREPYQRPDMGHVVNVLSSIVEQWKPVEAHPDDLDAIDYNSSLPEVLKKWQALEGTSRIGDSSTSSTFYGSRDTTQTSLPHPLSNSFTSGGR